MNLEEALTRTLHDHLDRMPVPTADVEAVCRVGERRRATVTAAGILASLAVVVGGVALVGGGDGDDGRLVQPAGLPAMDFDTGLRAFYDDASGLLHMGGQAFEVGRVNQLDVAASATPWGAVYMTSGQEVRLLAEDGTLRRLAKAPDDPVRFQPRVKFDAGQPLAAWLTRDVSGVLLTVYRFGDDEGIVATTRVSCEGRTCESQQIAGVDSGKVFVRDSGGTRVFDVDDLGAEPVRLPSYVVADVRNRVVLGEGSCCGDEPLGEGWRFTQAEGPESVLTFDGSYEVAWSSTLRETDGGKPLRLALPGRDGVEFMAMDTDGTVLVGVMTQSGVTYYDCETTGGCAVIGELGRRAGDPIFLGSDM